ncbi:MAG: hypothetical protein EOP48_22760 [Sphingobacteriales bacterium]|nr:MAG: hypothetical protein EOP48_22760 [Sphingobacteriales bacterium]
MIDTRIIPECYVDTIMIEGIGFRNPNHKLGIGETLKTLQLRGYKDKLGIAVIDKDKHAPKTLYSLYQLFRRVGNVEIRRQEGTKRFVIIHPNMEAWTYGEGQKAGINLSDFRLPGTYQGYRELCKSMKSIEHEGLKNYMNTLGQKETEIRIVRQIILELVAEFG